MKDAEKKSGIPVYLDWTGALSGKPWDLSRTGSTVMVFDAAGERRLAGKKPLIDPMSSGDLRRQIVAEATGSEARISVLPKYAAIHQFGGKAGRGLKVEIPARPYLPVRLDGSLYPQESALIVDAINDMLLDALD